MAYPKKVFTEEQYVVPKHKYVPLRRETAGNPVYRNLNTIRELVDLPQSAVAEKIGIKRETYSNYEKGRCHVPSSIITDLLTMYQIPADLIFGTTEKIFVKEFYTTL